MLLHSNTAQAASRRQRLRSSSLFFEQSHLFHTLVQHLVHFSIHAHELHIQSFSSENLKLVTDVAAQ